MIQTHHLKWADCETQPWKNGKGRTREIAVDSATPFRWRVSRATMEESAPFSAYPGYQRSLTLLGGGPVVLHHGTGKSRRLQPLSAYSFAGDLETRAEIEAPAEDFNVFALGTHAKAGCYPAYFRQDEEVQLPLAGQQHLVHCVGGQIEVFESSTDRSFVLEPGDTLLVTREGDAEHLNLRAKGVSPKAVALWVVVHCA